MLGIFSGECLKGICGEETDLFDYKGEKLFVGDIVLVYYNEYLSGPHSAYMSVVCNDKYLSYSDGTIKKQRNYSSYIMGIAMVKQEDLARDNEDGERTSGWVVEKIKDYKDCISGEKWKSYGFNYRNVENIDKLELLEV